MISTSIRQCQSRGFTLLPSRGTTLLPSRGFTLLEIVVSLGILATALIAIFRLQAQNLDLQSEAQFITIANHLAQDRISQIQSAENLEEGTSSGGFGDNFPGFYFQQEISKIQDYENFFKIKISITLEDQKYSKDLALETYLYRHET